MITPEEKVLFVALANCSERFAQLDDRSERDSQDFAYHVRQLQHIVMARLARRTDPGFCMEHIQ